MNPLVVSAPAWLLPAGGWERLAVDALWQSTALAGGGLLLGWLARRWAALRAAILLAAAILCVAVPVLSSAVRARGGGLLSPPDQSALHAEDFAPALAAIQKVELPPAEAMPVAAPRWVDPVAIAEPTPTPVAPLPREAAKVAMDAKADLPPRSLWPWLALGWLTLSAQLAWRLARGWLGLRRAIRAAEPCRDPEIRAELERAAETLGVRPPELLCSPAFKTPALAGWLRPRLLVPPDMPAGVDWFAVFCHELGHLARRDGLSRLAVELCLIALPWQPLVWLVRRQFRSACEEACDDWAVASGNDPVELASLLVELVPQPQPTLALGMAESRAATRRRVVRLLAMRGAVHPQLGLALGVLGWLLAVGLGVALAMLQYGRPAPREASSITTTHEYAPSYAPATGPFNDGSVESPAGVFYNYGAEPAKGAAGSPAPPPWGSEPLDEAIAKAAAALPKTPGQLPPYIIEPSDVLLIDAVKLVPKAPYHIESLDQLLVQVANPLIDQPIAGSYSVDYSGTINLGAAYGKVKVEGLTVEEAQEAVVKHLASILREPQVSVSLGQISVPQLIGGRHPVGPDGTVNLGTYGTVFVAGSTVAVAKSSIEQQLSQYLEQPRVSLDVDGYKTKVYYLIVQSGAGGDSVVRCPATGNETVLDALAQATGKLPNLAECWIWVARPGGQILPVDWQKVGEGTDTTSNWRIAAGDRIFIRRRSPATAAASQSAPLPQTAGNQMPISRAAGEHEAHFQLHGGRIAYVPFNEFVGKLRGIFEQTASKLRDNEAITEAYGPIGEFSVRYTISKVDIPWEEATKTGHGGTYIRLREFHFEPLAAEIGETVAEAMNRASKFRSKLDEFHRSHYTITLWVYPDSFHDLDRVRKELDQLGYSVAVRPISEGRAIGGSPKEGQLAPDTSASEVGEPQATTYTYTVPFQTYQLSPGQTYTGKLKFIPGQTTDAVSSSRMAARELETLLAARQKLTERLAEATRVLDELKASAAADSSNPDVASSVRKAERECESIQSELAANAQLRYEVSARLAKEIRELRTADATAPPDAPQKAFAAGLLRLSRAAERLESLLEFRKELAQRAAEARQEVRKIEDANESDARSQAQLPLLKIKCEGLERDLDAADRYIAKAVAELKQLEDATTQQQPAGTPKENAIPVPDTEDLFPDTADDPYSDDSDDPSATQ